jgi:hypothetical protein
MKPDAAEFRFGLSRTVWSRRTSIIKFSLEENPNQISVLLAFSNPAFKAFGAAIAFDILSIDRGFSIKILSMKSRKQVLEFVCVKTFHLRSSHCKDLWSTFFQLRMAKPREN